MMKYRKINKEYVVSIGNSEMSFKTYLSARIYFEENKDRVTQFFRRTWGKRDCDYDIIEVQFYYAVERA